MPKREPRAPRRVKCSIMMLADVYALADRLAESRHVSRSRLLEILVVEEGGRCRVNVGGDPCVPPAVEK
jgi:hypothetical protein